MESNEQFDAYAAFYDLLYKDKNYKAESEYIDTLIDKFLNRKKQNIALLDLACGTGRHLQELYRKGYASLSGSDISKSMIDIAKANAAKGNVNIDFYNYSFQTSNNIKKKVDVVISMFSAVNYITSYEDQCLTLKNVYSLLNNDGLFIFDFWNGNSVTKNYSPTKVLRKKEGNSEIMRISETKLDLINQDATVKFTCMYSKDNLKVSEFEEIHRLHYYYFSEMKNLLTAHRFEILHTSPFMDIGGELSAMDWNISIVTRKLS